MDEQIVRYVATDGQEVELYPAKVVGLIATGGGEPDPHDVAAFIAKCQARGLNPLAGDCYMTTYKSRKTGKVSTSVVVSKDYYMRVAAQTSTFRGFRAGIAVATADGQLVYREGSMTLPGEYLLGGWAEVADSRLDHPHHHEISREEYDQQQSVWLEKPATMCRSVALKQALREVYPAMFAGTYDQDEMPEPEPVTATYEVEE